LRYVELIEVPDVRKFIESLGENPVDAYYQTVLKRKEQISKKAGFFGGVSTKGSKKEKAKPDLD
jgi:hypothetical protein